MRLCLVVIVLFAVAFSACNSVSGPQDAPLVADLPTMSVLADSLAKTGAKSYKWAVHNDSIVYAYQANVDWKKEFEAFVQDNINHLRYRDAYDVSDTVIGTERVVIFTARTPAQEIRSMEMRLRKGRIHYYRLEKARKNLLAESSQTFVFDGIYYEIHIKQSIKWLFSNEQFVHGTIVEGADMWRVSMDLGDKKMPVQVILNMTAKNPTLYVKNGKELIGFNKFSRQNDSLVFGSDYFNSFFRLKLTSDSTMEGVWTNAKTDQPQVIPVTAARNVIPRFEVLNAPALDLSGSHTAVFYTPDGALDDSTLLNIEQREHFVTGSFLTETGDYRFLEGVVRNDSLFMSALDGAHAYLFEAGIENGTLKGSFWSGNRWKQPWVAHPFQAFNMRDPEGITYVKPDSVFRFSFKDPSGQSISLNDPVFENKVVMVSVMGTWCSNCMDEALFLKEAYEAYHTRGLEVVALDFEMVTDSAKALQNIDRHTKNLKLEYPVLLASLGATKEKAASALPSLNGIFSYPTLIIMDRSHNVVRIHTGFSGPATGKDHEVFRQEYLGLIDSLVGVPVQ